MALELTPPEFLDPEGPGVAFAELSPADQRAITLPLDTVVRPAVQRIAKALAELAAARRAIRTLRPRVVALRDGEVILSNTKATGRAANVPGPSNLTREKALRGFDLIETAGDSYFNDEMQALFAEYVGPTAF